MPSIRAIFSKPFQFNNHLLNSRNTGWHITCHGRNVLIKNQYLPEEPSISAQDTLIIPRIEYNKNDMYKVNISGSTIVVKFTEALQRHEDWGRVAYTQDLNN